MNRVFVAMHEGVEEPEWFNNVEAFVQKALCELKFDGEENVEEEERVRRANKLSCQIGQPIQETIINQCANEPL